MSAEVLESRDRGFLNFGLDKDRYSTQRVLDHFQRYLSVRAKPTSA